MAEFRKREDINQELDILQTWSELGAPRLDDLSRSLSSLVRTVDPRLMEDMTPSQVDLHVSEAPPEFANLPPGDEEQRPRQGGLLLVLGVAALLAAAGALYMAWRGGHLLPHPAATPGELGTAEPSAEPSIMASPVPTPSPSIAPSPSPSPSPSPLLSPSPSPALTSPAPSPAASPVTVPVVVPSPAMPSAHPSVAASAHVTLPTPHAHPATPHAVATPSEAMPTSAPTPHGHAPAHGGAYTVRSGDSLSAIAASELGDMARWTEIYAMNRDVVSDPDVIHPNTRLRMPGEAAPAAAPRASHYMVRPGDTLKTIAEAQLGSTSRWRELYDLNRDKVPSPSLLRPGLSLRLPGAGAAPGGRVHARRPSVASAQAITHVVQAGESLSLLARRYLGSASRWREIYYLNSHKIANAHWIYPGQHLAIPQGQAAGHARYVVRVGDTLWTIAGRQLGDSTAWPSLYQANRDRIADPHWIYPGQTLRVPR